MASISSRTQERNGQSHVARVYVASPKPTFGTRRYARMLERARLRFPHARIIKAHGHFASNEAWLEQWPELLETLSALAFFSEADGTVGMGVCREVTEAQARGLPVQYLANDGGWHMSDAFDLVPHELRTPRRFAHVQLAGE